MSLDTSEFARRVDEDARLVILRALAAMPSGMLNDTLIEEALAQFGHRRSRDWLRTQLNKLAELGAVLVEPAGSVVVVSITHAGTDHVERRCYLEGVRRPSAGR
ncbi:hypothetical protein V5G24_00155 [Xanthobacter sp. VTT E-85241]|uniref:VpaChn25_0724 family phage protein n=1 Tax=Roseixanthobacter finlandensis TaxID=3119922 RepID=UPI00372CA1B8